jgi:hypothetical protein
MSAGATVAGAEDGVADAGAAVSAAGAVGADVEVTSAGAG